MFNADLSGSPVETHDPRRPRNWKTACLRTFSGRWIYAVVFNGGQCSGSYG